MRKDAPWHDETMQDAPRRLSPEQVALALGEGPARAVLAACVARARSVREISDATHVPLTTAYRQVHRLERLGVLIVERSALTPDGRKYDLYRSRIRRAELHVDEEGAHISWEPDLAVEERLASMWDDLQSAGRMGRDEKFMAA